MAKKMLTRAKVLGLVVDGGRLGPSHGVCRKPAPVAAGDFGPAFDEPAELFARDRARLGRAIAD